MKIGENITLYTGAQPVNGRVAEEAQKEQEQRKTLFAGDINQGNTLRDRIAQRKEQARRQAMQVVGDALAGRKTVDEGLDESRARFEDLKREERDLKEEAAGVEERRQELEEAYAAGEIDQAQYLSEKAALDQEERAYQGKLADNRAAQMGEEAVIRGTKRELPKDQSMLKARDQAEEIRKAAGEEIMGMVLEESRDHIDEESRKREEQAGKIREEQEKLEEIQKKRDEREEELEKLLASAPVEEMVSLDQLQDEIRQDIQNIVDKMKVLSDDIKGAMVDEAL